MPNRLQSHLTGPCRLLLLLALLPLLLSAGCALQSPPAKPSLSELNSIAMEEYSNGRYLKAIDGFKKIRSRFPKSNEARIAELKIADSRYYLKEFFNARYLYEEFEKDHPDTPYIPYVIQQIGLCFLHDKTDPDGPENAIATLNRLVATYPNGPYTGETRKRIAAIRAQQQKLTKGIDQTSAKDLADRGMDMFNRGRYFSALEIFDKIKDRFPFSTYGILAELKAADSNFHMRNYDEARVLYEEFEKNHPTHEQIPYVLFQVGMCHVKKIKTVDRDTSGATNSIAVFSRLIRTFPESPYVPEAKERIKSSREFLAGHELYVARFYAKIKLYEQAKGRLEALLLQYPGSETAADAGRLLEKVKQQITQSTTETEDPTFDEADMP